MSITGPLISLVFIVLVVWLLARKYYPHAVLLFSGLAMLIVAWLLGYQPSGVSGKGFFGIELFRSITHSFSKTDAGVGLMIMAIGGFVAYIDKIGASEALVHLAMKPLRLLKRYPNLTAAAVIPIGQVLFVCIPSAAGLGLLLVASVYPILVNLGVSKLSAVSVITACTAFGIGPASAITASAAKILEVPSITYFFNHQIPLVIPLTIVVTISYYFVNRYYDKRDKSKPEEKEFTREQATENNAPAYYAIIPVLPLILLILFSDVFQFFKVPVILDTTTAMFISLIVAMIFELFRTRSVKHVFQSLTVFWGGMGNIFKTVVTLIIAADIFSKGLISLGFIRELVHVSQSFGFAAVGVGIIMTVMIYFASMLMGSGNASFFAFGPLVPKIASSCGVDGVSMLLPMNLAASMGRTVSPISGVLIATSGVVGVSALSIAKRNLIPMGAALLTMLIYHYV